MTILTVGSVLLVGLPEVMGATSAAASAVPACTASSVRVTDHNTLVGAGNVNDLFWIRNVNSTECTLRGYVRVEYVGAYGTIGTHAKSHLLVVREKRSYGRNGNDIGGLKRGLPVPTVTLQEHGVASFWLYGTDEQHGGPGASRCIVSHMMLVWLPGSSTPLEVQPLKSNGFWWCGGFAAHPIVPGESGSDPAVRLSYYFGG